MLTCADSIELKTLKQEWEFYEALLEQFPNRLDLRKKADSLELLIINIENNNKYCQGTNSTLAFIELNWEDQWVT